MPVNNDATDTQHSFARESEPVHIAGRSARLLRTGAVAAIGLLALVGCTQSNPPPSTADPTTVSAAESPTAEPTATPTAAPTPAADAGIATLNGTINETDADGYTYMVEYELEVGRFASDISQAKPGYFDAVATAGTQVIQVTNTTQGRAAPGWSGRPGRLQERAGPGGGIGLT